MRESDGERRRRRFDALFASYSSDIVTYCCWRADSASDAQDAVAEAFLVAWRRLDELPDGDAARVWLYATARKVIANQRRSSRRRLALYERLALEAASAPRQSFPADREEALVHEALDRLAPRDREVLLLAEWEDLSSAEIAGALGCLATPRRSRRPTRDRCGIARTPTSL
jgi:RNA polymerase sigma factor (sigma-70 family)